MQTAICNNPVGKVHNHNPRHIYDPRRAPLHQKRGIFSPLTTCKQ